MDILEILYDNPPKSRRFLPRKVSIQSPKTLIYGARGSGKSSIIIDHLSTRKSSEVLYIDFSDIRVDEIGGLQEFIDSRRIKLVVLEHFADQCAIPRAEEVIISTTRRTELEGFESVQVHPLDFEEFISFDKKHQNIEHIFNLFANIGTLPAVVLGLEEAKYRHIQSLMRSYLGSSRLAILRAMATHQSRSFSTFGLYKQLSPSMALSKDGLYRHIDELEREFFVYFVPRFGSSGANRKLFFADFALKNALTFERDFIARFENIVFCELMKRGGEIYYTEGLDFYLPGSHTALICVPFLPPELIRRRFARLLKELKTLEVTSLQVITVGNEGSFEDEGVTCEILPFWEWALG
jgi:predicted AAA+ superfamily ATPase